MGRLGKKTIGKLSSLTALGAGALAVAPTADASVITNLQPITLNYTLGAPSVSWLTGDGGSVSLPGPRFGFSLYQCRCGVIAAGFLIRGSLAVPSTVISNTLMHGTSFRFLRFNQPGYFSLHRSTAVSYPLLGVASFKSSSSNLLSGGLRQFQNRLVEFAFFNTSHSSTNFGWMELSMSASADNPLTEQLTIDAYAYDDSGYELPAGAVPEPGTMGPTALGALALGAVGLRRWRAARRKPE